MVGLVTPTSMPNTKVRGFDDESSMITACILMITPPSRIPHTTLSSPLRSIMCVRQAGMSISPTPNPLKHVLNAIGEDVEWLTYGECCVGRCTAVRCCCCSLLSCSCGLTMPRQRSIVALLYLLLRSVPVIICGPQIMHEEKGRKPCGRGKEYYFHTQSFVLHTKIVLEPSV